jgi:hypothetical protein
VEPLCTTFMHLYSLLFLLFHEDINFLICSVKRSSLNCAVSPLFAFSRLAGGRASLSVMWTAVNMNKQLLIFDEK